MKKMYALAVGLAFVGTALAVPGTVAADQHQERGRVAYHHRHGEHQAKNIIFMVPDGMGLADVTAARIAKFGLNGDRLSFEKLPVIGYQSTHSANSTVTDSAAAASAWACGEKYVNGEICFHSDTGAEGQSILEYAKLLGKSTGLVATSTITHATPAAFGAHVYSRKCETEIAHQYVDETMVDILLGGGVGTFQPTEPDRCGNGDDIVAEASANGYTVVYTADELTSAVAMEPGKLLGLFNASGMTPEYLRTEGITEPRLPEMASAALDLLEEDQDGFFLMVEGSQIDWANHANDPEYQLGEMLAFDEAVQTVLEWVNDNPKRRNETLVIVVADHETGGYAINGPYGSLSEAGDLVEAGWTSGGHTAVDTLVWSQGPGSERLGKALDNTDLYGVMMDTIK